MNKFKGYGLYLVLGIILVVGGISFALLSVILDDSTDNIMIAGTLAMTLDESNSLTLNNAIPVKDEDGMAGDAFTFDVENTGNIDAGYIIYLEDLALEAGQTKIPGANIKYELKVNGVTCNIGYLSESDTVLYTNNIKPTGLTNFELRLWLAYETTSLPSNSVFASQLRIEATQVMVNPVTVCNNAPKEEDTTLGCTDIPSYGGVPNEPELVGDMIPVVYDEAQSEWVKADVSSEWYSYIEWEWANAVTVTETNRAALVASTAGTVIPMDDINAMFVWIPRYSYTIKDTYGVQGCGGSTSTVDTPGSFDIKWVESSITDLGTASYTGDTAENWFTNSSFCWGDTCDDISTREDAGNRELSGIWVGKFETSTTGGTETNEIQQPIIKPTVTSWRKVDVANMFNSIQQYMNSINGESIFGLSGSTYDTHMLKNTEWGAVAYLSQSKYGKYGNTNYIGAEKELAINNCVIYVTGVGGDTVSAALSIDTCTANTYETEKGQTASTTGNIYGIYDMSGGAWEYVMGNMENSSNAFNVMSSGFTTPPADKYYNSYAYNTDTATGRILGDSTKETAWFYGDYQQFLTSSYPWFLRGGTFGDTTSGGVFYSNFINGISYSAYGFRVSISP